MVIVREYLDTMAERLGIDPDMLKFLSTTGAAGDYQPEES